MAIADIFKKVLLNKQSELTRKIGSKTETLKFEKIPASLEELKAFPEADLKSPFKTAALTVLALMNYENNNKACLEMLEFLNGPENLSTVNQQFLEERLTDKYYKPFSFFEGATPENGYTPKQPYTIKISANQYSYPEENHAVLWLHSGGADQPREINLRKKPSTGEWFIYTYNFLADIRAPKEQDPWA